MRKRLTDKIVRDASRHWIERATTFGMMKSPASGWI